jgi:hypothetical protein
MEENGSIRDDMKLPAGTDESEKLADQIRAEFAEGKEIMVSVLKVGPGANLHGLAQLSWLTSPSSSADSFQLAVLFYASGHERGDDQLHEGRQPGCQVKQQQAHPSAGRQPSHMVLCGGTH